MNWMNVRKGSWACFLVIAITVLFSMPSCGVPKPTHPLALTDTPVSTTAIASGSTDTPTPNSTLAATDTPTKPYPAPILVNPASGATIMGGELISFSWQWDGALQERERFDLRIWRPEKPAYTVAMARESGFPLDTPLDGFGQYQWQVAVVRIDESGNKSLLSESQISPFVWTDVTPTSNPTATPTPTPTPTPTQTPTQTPIADAVVNAKNLNLRSGPGMVYDRLGVLEQGDPLKVTGRNLAGDWLRVIAHDGQEGWVAASLLEINVPLADVTTAQAPSTPTPMYTPTPTVTPTPELLVAPTLLEPKAGEGDFAGSVVLKWRWERPLEKDEYFSIRVRNEKVGECHHTQVQEPAYVGGLSYCPSGEYYWQVAVVRKLCEDCPNEQRWQTLSQPSEDWLIRYHAVDEEDEEGPGPKEPKEPK